MRTPTVVLAGQGDTDAAAVQLLCRPGTLVIEHRFDGHVVRRRQITLQQGVMTSAETVLELAHGCLSCTIRNDLLILLRKVHRRHDVDRIVIHLAPWLEPEPICWAIRHVRVSMGPGFIDGPAARDVEIDAVITCLDVERWLPQALGDVMLGDGRTVAQVVVAQAEFADVLVGGPASSQLIDVLCRLNPRAGVIPAPDALEDRLARLPGDARRSRSDDPHGPLLAGQPPLTDTEGVQLMEFRARRPFHPQRLHDAVDVLLDGVIRARGRLWLASNPAQVMWLESAGGGLRVSSAGRWLAELTDSELAYVDPERRALAAAMWDDEHGDRHTSMTVLLCGAGQEDVTDTLRGALLTDDELRHPQRWPTWADPFGDWHEEPCTDNPGRPAQSLIGDTTEGDHE